MNFASNYAFISHKSRNVMPSHEEKLIGMEEEDEDLNLNVFIVTFEGVKTAEKELSGGDPYHCKDCSAILNKFSKIYWQDSIESLGLGKEK